MIFPNTTTKAEYQTLNCQEAGHLQKKAHLCKSFVTTVACTLEDARHLLLLAPYHFSAIDQVN